MARRSQQLGLKLRTWGGKRKGAGRKRPPGARRRVAHRARSPRSGREPLHVTWRMSEDLPSLRGPRCREHVRAVLASHRAGSDLRVVEWSAQRDHLHLVVECPAQGAAALANGLRSIASKLHRRLNRALGRRGPLLADRYHVHVLRSLREVVHAVRYVWTNAHHHGAGAAGARWWPTASWRDPCSSAAGRCAVPRTWLLRRALDALEPAAPR